MKRTLLLAALVAAAAACAGTPPHANTNHTTNTANVNANSTIPASSPAEVSDSDIIEREKRAWDALKAKDFDGFRRMLSDDFVLVTSDGIHDRTRTIEGLGGLTYQDVALSDFKVLKLDKDAVLVTYTAKVKGVAQGQTEAMEMRSRDSTAWLNRGGQWVAVYHQDSEIKQAQAAPSPAPSPASATTTAAASPSATPAADADPVSLEKAIWETLKRRDYDAFASYLAPEQLEVSLTGVNDKAASVNGVRQFDFKGVTLGDFKETKLDDDASLVTYTVKGPKEVFGPEGERNSTIWVNRGGRWLAFFHQGTAIAKPRK